MCFLFNEVLDWFQDKVLVYEWKVLDFVVYFVQDWGPSVAPERISSASWSDYARTNQRYAEVEPRKTWLLCLSFVVVATTLLWRLRSSILQVFSSWSPGTCLVANIGYLCSSELFSDTKNKVFFLFLPEIFKEFSENKSFFKRPTLSEDFFAKLKLWFCTILS